MAYFDAHAKNKLKPEGVPLRRSSETPKHPADNVKNALSGKPCRCTDYMKMTSVALKATEKSWFP